MSYKEEGPSYPVNEGSKISGDPTNNICSSSVVGCNVIGEPNKNVVKSGEFITDFKQDKKSICKSEPSEVKELKSNIDFDERRIKSLNAWGQLATIRKKLERFVYSRESTESLTNNEFYKITNLKKCLMMPRRLKVAQFDQKVFSLGDESAMTEIDKKYEAFIQDCIQKWKAQYKKSVIIADWLQKNYKSNPRKFENWYKNEEQGKLDDLFKNIRQKYKNEIWKKEDLDEMLKESPTKVNLYEKRVRKKKLKYCITMCDEILKDYEQPPTAIGSDHLKISYMVSRAWLVLETAIKYLQWIVYKSNLTNPLNDSQYEKVENAKKILNHKQVLEKAQLVKSDFFQYSGTPGKNNSKFEKKLKRMLFVQLPIIQKKYKNAMQILKWLEENRDQSPTKYIQTLEKEQTISDSDEKKVPIQTCKVEDSRLSKASYTVEIIESHKEKDKKNEAHILTVFKKELQTSLDIMKQGPTETKPISPKLEIISKEKNLPGVQKEKSSYVDLTAKESANSRSLKEAFFEQRIIQDIKKTSIEIEELKKMNEREKVLSRMQRELEIEREMLRTEMELERERALLRKEQDIYKRILEQIYNKEHIQEEEEAIMDDKTSHLSSSDLSRWKDILGNHSKSKETNVTEHSKQAKHSHEEASISSDIDFISSEEDHSHLRNPKTHQSSRKKRRNKQRRETYAGKSEGDEKRVPENTKRSKYSYDDLTSHSESNSLSSVERHKHTRKPKNYQSTKNKRYYDRRRERYDSNSENDEKRILEYRKGSKHSHEYGSRYSDSNSTFSDEEYLYSRKSKTKHSSKGELTYERRREKYDSKVEKYQRRHYGRREESGPNRYYSEFSLGKSYRSPDRKYD